MDDEDEINECPGCNSTGYDEDFITCEHCDAIGCELCMAEGDTCTDCGEMIAIKGLMTSTPSDP